MPQLDRVIFFDMSIFLCFLFAFFFLIFLVEILPLFFWLNVSQSYFIFYFKNFYFNTSFNLFKIFYFLFWDDFIVFLLKTKEKFFNFFLILHFNKILFSQKI